MKRVNVFVAAAAGCAAFLASVAFADSSGGAQVSDAQLTHRVMGKLAVDDPQLASRIQVSVKDGVVTLSGLTYNGLDAAKALRDAGSVEGVVKVENHLTIEQ
jgi:hyperosmotically inducible periplasmic protein